MGQPDNQKLYELSNAQEMIAYMLRFSLHKQVIQIPASVLVDKTVDFDIMKKAVNIEIARNDCMRLRFIRKGIDCKQYFLDEFHLDNIPVLHFGSSEEQERYLTNDAQTPVRHMTGETFRIILFRAFDGRYGVFINVCHLCMDAAAVFIFFADLLAVYDSLANGTPLPKPIGSYELALQNELKLKADKDFILAEEEIFTSHLVPQQTPVFLDAHGISRLKTARKIHRNPDLALTGCFNPVFDKAKSIGLEASPEDSNLLFNFCRSFGVSPEVLVQLGMHIHLSSINDGYDDHCFLDLCTRRNNRNTKRCGGTMTSALTWRTKLPKTLTFSQSLKNLTELQGWMFRHMDFPFLSCRRLLQKLFPCNPISYPAPTMFSWFPLENNSMCGWDYEFRTYNIGRYCMPLYTMAMRNAKTGCLKISYLYRTHYLTKDDIVALFNRTVRSIIIGISNPELTLKEITDKL